jgi:hypothetical protein
MLVLLGVCGGLEEREDGFGGGFGLCGQLGFEGERAGCEGGEGLVDGVALGGGVGGLGLGGGETLLQVEEGEVPFALALHAALEACGVGLCGGDEAEGGLVDDGLDGLFGGAAWLVLGQRGGGDLKAVEEDAAAAGVDAVHGDGVEDVGD